jgi:hypothetical protein
MATRNLAPRADGEGNIGTSTLNWLSGFFKTLNVLGAMILSQISTPSNPSSGKNKLYFKSDDKLYKLTSAGVESEVGSASDPTKIITGNTEVATTDTGSNGKVEVKPEGTVEGTFDANGLSLKTGASVNEFSIDTTLAGNSDDAVPTEKAVKAYVDNKATLVRATFVNGDLSTGKLTVTHSKALSAPYSVMVVVFDNNYKLIIPDEVTGATNSFEIDLTSYGSLAGTWGYAYIA